MCDFLPCKLCFHLLKEEFIINLLHVHGILIKLNTIPLIDGYLVKEIPFKNPVVAISTHINISDIDSILKYTTPILKVEGSSGINSLIVEVQM